MYKLQAIGTTSSPDFTIIHPSKMLPTRTPRDPKVERTTQKYQTQRVLRIRTRNQTTHPPDWTHTKDIILKFNHYPTTVANVSNVVPSFICILDYFISLKSIWILNVDHLLIHKRIIINQVEVLNLYSINRTLIWYLKFYSNSLLNCLIGLE